MGTLAPHQDRRLEFCSHALSHALRQHPAPASRPSIPPGPRTPQGLPEPRPSSRRLPDRHPVPARPRPGFAQEKQEMRCSRSVSLLRNWSAGGVSCIPPSASRPSLGPRVGVLTASPYSPAWRTSDSAGGGIRGEGKAPAHPEDGLQPHTSLLTTHFISGLSEL